MLQYAGAQVPVTALAFCGEHCLVGAGNVLRVISRSSTRLIQQRTVFEETSIHGLVIHDVHKAATSAFDIVAWGAGLASILRLEHHDGGSTLRCILPPFDCGDWILAASVGEANVAAFVTAHNAIFLLPLNSPSTVQLQEVRTAQSRSILSSAAVSWESDDSILVASGTIFGEILVWSVGLENGQTASRLHKVFLGHEGSPFGLSISPIHGHHGRRLLASCGDDRSIRLWDITSLSSSTFDLSSGVTSGQMDSHTGFNGSLIDPHLLSKDPVAQIRAHQSRIWAVIFVAANDQDDLDLISFGEDATAMVWACKLASATDDGWNKPLEVVLRHHFQAHGGKHIWSHATSSCLQSKTAIVLTGGADGCIAFSQYPWRSTTPDSVDMSARVAVQSKAPAGRKLRTFHVIQQNRLLYITDGGHFSSRMLQTEISTYHGVVHARTNDVLAHVPDFAGFSIMTGTPQSSCVFISGRSGSIYLCSPGLFFRQLVEGKGKTAGLFVTRLEDPDHPLTLLFSTVLSTSNAVLIMVDDAYATGVGSELPLRQCELMLPPGEVITSFGAPRRDGESLIAIILGCRSGAIYSYEAILSLDSVQLIDAGEPSKVLAHGDAVTDIKILELHGQALIVTVCRDGSLCVHRLGLKGAPVLQTVHKLIMPGLSDARSLYLTDSKLRVAGFKRKSFAIWDVVEEQELFSIDCDGSHRSWTFDWNKDGAGGTVVFNQGGATDWHRLQDSPVARVNPGGHGREIKALAMTPLDSPVSHLLATGAEDTAIKLGRLEQDRTSGQTQYRCIRTLRKHTTGIQALTWSHDGRRLISSGGCEELFVWRIRNVPLLEIGVVCESSCPFLSAVPDLRITALSTTDRADSIHGDSDNDEDEHAAALTIVAARSDSTIHVYCYKVFQNAAPSWACLYVGTGTTCSLTNVLQLAVPGGEDNEGREVLLATGTDGHAMLSRAVARHAIKGANDNMAASSIGKLEWRTRFKLHQSAVLSADSAQCTAQSRVLVTGGDDGALSITRVVLDARTTTSGETSDSVWTMTLPRAHAAAVSAVRILGSAPSPRPSTPGGSFTQTTTTTALRIVSVGLDQRVKLWQLIVEHDWDMDGNDEGSVDADRLRDGGIQISRLEDVYTPVADVAAVWSWVDGENEWVLVCGVGWQVFKVPEQQR